MISLITTTAEAARIEKTMNTQDNSMTEQQVAVWFDGLADPDAICPQKTELQVWEMIEARRAANGNDQ